MADVVAVEHLGDLPLLEERVLEGVGDGGLAGAGEAGEPQHAALLVHRLLAGGLVHGTLVPLDVGGVANLVGVHLNLGGADMLKTRVCAKEAAGPAARKGVAAWARVAKRASSRRERIVDRVRCVVRFVPEQERARAGAATPDRGRRQGRRERTNGIFLPLTLDPGNLG